METPMSDTFLNQSRLASRWHLSPRTLERWRWKGEGPAYLKLGGRVVYRIEDILAYEQARERQSTAHVPVAGART
jgi:predicted site-specific integrase-resolvase